jgi:hypothetical protein
MTKHGVRKPGQLHIYYIIYIIAFEATKLETGIETLKMDKRIAELTSSFFGC